MTGKEEFLGERMVAEVRRAVTGFDPESELGETQAADLTLATLGELSAPSLFSSIRCVIVRGLENLPDESVAGLLDYAAAPSEEVALVLVHSGGARGSGVLAKLRKLRAVTEHKCAEPKSSEFPKFVAAEVRSFGGRIEDGAIEFLLQAVGQDLRALSAAAHQLVDDFPGETLTEDRVKQYFGGRAEVKNYVIADAILAGQRVKALEELRWSMDRGTSPVYILSAVAGQLRSVANHAAGNRDGNLPPWRRDSLGRLARGWSTSGLGLAIRAVAAADADLKGGASDPAYTMERMVLTVTALREHAR